MSAKFYEKSLNKNHTYKGLVWTYCQELVFAQLFGMG